MKVQTGYLYHIKDDFFNKVKDENLMSNHELGRKRPSYFVIKDKEILWFIPLSSKVEKYQRIIDKKIKKYGVCNSILIREIKGEKNAILLQNAFPTLDKYIDHIHITDGKPVKVINTIKDEIIENFNIMMKLKQHGINLFFTDIDKIKQQMLDEILVKE